jgi:putative transposase
VSKNDDELRKRMKQLLIDINAREAPVCKSYSDVKDWSSTTSERKRIYKQEALSPRKRPGTNSLSLPRGSMPAASGTNEVLSIDSLSDALADGRRFRILAIVDGFTKLSLGFLVYRSLPAKSLSVRSSTSGQR